MIESTSRSHAVVSALVAALRAVVDSDVTVLYGPPVGSALPWKVIAVAVGDPAVNATVVRVDGLGHRYQEDVLVHCVASVLSGDSDMDTAHADAQAMLDLVDAVVKTEPPLSGACDQLMVARSQMDYRFAQVADGAVAEIEFAVIARSLL